MLNIGVSCRKDSPTNEYRYYNSKINVSGSNWRPRKKGGVIVEQMQIREKVIEELKMISDEKMEKVYDFIHNLNTDLQRSATDYDKLMSFAGCWSDMPDNDFSEFIQEIRDRRAQHNIDHFSRIEALEIADWSSLLP